MLKLLVWNKNGACDESNYYEIENAKNSIMNWDYPETLSAKIIDNDNGGKLTDWNGTEWS